MSCGYAAGQFSYKSIGLKFLHLESQSNGNMQIQIRDCRLIVTLVILDLICSISGIMPVKCLSQMKQSKEILQSPSVVTLYHKGTASNSIVKRNLAGCSHSDIEDVYPPQRNANTARAFGLTRFVRPPPSMSRTIDVNVLSNIPIAEVIRALQGLARPRVRANRRFYF